VTAIHDGGTVMTPELTRDYAAKYGAEICVKAEDMIGKVDIVLIHSVDWDKHLPRAIPFMQSGVPVFIDKPLCGNTADAKKFLEWRDRGALIYGSSSLRYTVEVDDYLALPVDKRGAEFRVVNGIVGTDEFNYAIHVAEMLGGLLGPGFEVVRFLGTSGPVELFSARHSCGALVTFQRNGLWLPFSLGVTTDKGYRAISTDNSRLYKTMLDKMFAALPGRKPIAALEDIVESVKLLLAAKLSIRDAGREVSMCEPELDRVSYDGPAFAAEYAPVRRASLLKK